MHYYNRALTIIGFPEMDKIRKQENTREIPVIFEYSWSRCYIDRSS